MKRFVSFLLVAVLVLSFLQLSAFSVSITSISFTPADKDAYTFYEGENAEWKHDDSTDTDYYSYAINFNEGDTLTVNFSDGSKKDYIADFIDGEIYFVNGNEAIKQWDDITREEDQWENHWTVGNEYTFYFVYQGFKAPVTARILANPVAEISYTPREGSITRYFETGGEVDTDDNSQEYYRYNAIERSSDDVLTVSYNDGRGDINYVLKWDPEPMYISETDPNDVIPENEVDMFDEQREEHFVIGDGNCIYVRYKGKIASVKVNIVKNPISAIVYTPVTDIVLYENANGEWRVNDKGQEYFDYNFWYRAGDKLAVTYSDTGNTVVYTFLDGTYNDEYYNGFYDDEYNELPDSKGEHSKLYVSRTGEWELGNDNYVCAKYIDNESNNVRVNIIENPVKAIRFEREFNAEFIEGSDMYYDNFDDAYYYNIPYHREGDKLIIIDKDDAETVYEYSNEKNAYCADGKDDIPDYDVSFGSEQREEPWVIGDNTYFVEYLGFRYNLTAKVNDNPVDSIEYSLYRPVTYIENTNTYYDQYDGRNYYERPRMSVGDKLIVNYKDPSRGSVEYTATRDNATGDLIFVSDSDSISSDNDIICFYDDQREQPWTVGVNYCYVEYSGKRAEVPVTIVENNLKSISYKSVKMPQVWVGDYKIPDFQDGDILTITYNDDSTKDFELIFDKADGERYFVNGEDAFHKNALFVPENQNISNWSVGTDNFYTVDFYGLTTEIQVEVKDTDIKSISYTPVAEIVLKENEGGNFCFNDFGRFFEYDRGSFVKEGDKLTVEYGDGTVTEYTFSIDPIAEAPHLKATDGSELNIEEFELVDGQWDNPWKPGVNYFTIKYHGVSSGVVAVTIKPVCGDINGDEVINNKDLTRFLQYITGWDVEINEKAIDVNGDGFVDNKDLIRLFKYLSGWDVQIC